MLKEMHETHKVLGQLTIFFNCCLIYVTLFEIMDHQGNLKENMFDIQNATVV